MNSNTTFFRKSDTSRTASGPRIHLAAFGKHPGWDDHMEDVGLETEALLLTKKLLYSEGVRGQLEANDPHSWNQLEKTQPGTLLPKFEHLFLWQRGISFVAGRFWSSRDGKGRTRYPMVVCAHTVNVPLQWIIERVLPRLAEAQKDCTATESADAVRTAIGRHLATLQSEWAATRPEATPEPGLKQEMEAFLNRPELGPERQGLLRVLYEVRTRMLPFERGGSQKGEPAKAAQTRLPLCAGSIGEAFVLWRRFFEVQLASGTPLLLVAPQEGEWLDAVAGDPSPADFFCLRANLAAVPLATSVPYKISDSLKEKCDQLVAALVKGLSSVPAPAQTTKEEPLHTTWLQRFISGGGKSSLLAVVLLAIGLAVGVPLLRRDSPKTPTPSAKSGGASPDTAAARADPATPAPTKKPEAASQAVEQPPQTAKSTAKQSPDTTAIATGPAPRTEPPSVPVPTPAPIAPKPSTEIRAAAAPQVESPTLQPGATSSNAQPESLVPVPTIAATPPSVTTTVPPVLADSAPKSPPAATLPPVGAPPTTAPPTPTPESTSPTASPVILAAKAPPQPSGTAPAAAPAVTKHDLKNSLGMEFVWLPGLPGTAKGGWVSKHEVTQELFGKVVGRNPSLHDQEHAAAGGYEWSPQLPVENLGHQEAVEFCDALTRKEREAGNLPAGWVYALPTEEQWNFFLGDARWRDAVTSREQPYGQELKAPFRVGQKAPNQFGLYDVLGNVWEWCRSDHGGAKLFKGSAFNSRKVISLNKLEPTYAGSSTGGAVPSGVYFSGAVGFRCVVVPQA